MDDASKKLTSLGCDSEGLSPCCTGSIVHCPGSSISYFKDEREVFNPAKLELIDSSKNAYLFQGNMPETEDSQFAYDVLMSSVKSHLEAMKKPLSDNPILIDVSFVNYTTEAEALNLEIEWYKKNPLKGCFWGYPLVGMALDPLLIPFKSVRNILLRLLDIDGIPKLMDKLQELLQSTCPQTTIIYMHCRGGVERMGIAAACYRMQFLGHSYQVATSGKSNEFRSMIRNGIIWYAFYLREVKGISTVGLIEGQ